MRASPAEQAALTWAERVRAVQPETPAPKRRLALVPAPPRAPRSPAEPDVDEFERPARWADCEGGERPCPWVGCRHHLYLDVFRGEIHTTTSLEVWEMAETCSLDLAAREGMTLEEVSEIFGITRERIRQIEDKALRRLKRIEEKQKKQSFLVEEARLLGLVKPAVRRRRVEASPEAPERVEDDDEGALDDDTATTDPDDEEEEDDPADAE